MMPTLTSSKTDTSKAEPEGAFQALEDKLVSYAQGQIKDDVSLERVLPASPMQEALVSEMVRTSYKAYFNHDVLKLSKDVSLERLEQAWHNVIAASPILRTGFLEIEDPDLNVTFAQIIHGAGHVEEDHIKLPSENAIDEHLAHIGSSVSSAALFQPQLRLTWASTPKDNYLVFSIAHALYDGHSLSLLHQDVQNAYKETLQSRPFYADILRDTFHGSNEDAVVFWRAFLTDAKKTQLPRIRDNGTSGTTTHRAEKTSILAAKDLSSFCKQQGVTLQAVCQTAWAFVLAHIVQSLDVMFGVVLAGRDSELAEEVMFPMINTVIMRSILHGSRKDVLQSIQATISDITNHQHFPLRQIQAACQGQVQSPTTGQSDAFFDSLFTFQRRPDVTENDTEMLYESVNGASEVEYPVAVEAEIVDGSLIWRVAGKSSAFNDMGVTNLLDTLDGVLHEIVKQPHEPTLTFENRQVSVCGLPAFQQQAELGASPTADASDGIVEDEETWSDTESAVREAIAKVTKTPESEISKTASIQNLGVDSINAIKISALLRQKAIRITVSEIVRASTVSKIASVAQNKQTDKRPQAEVDTADNIVDSLMTHKGFTPDRFDYETRAIEQILPATAGQVYMLGAWQATNGHLFFGEFEYITTVSTTMDRIKQAWQKLVAGNAVLRTVFVATQDNEMPFLQLVLRDAPAWFVDLDNEERSSSSIKQPFVRLTAQKVDETYKLILKIHHTLYDAVSLSLLSQELGGYLQGSAAAQQSPVKFADFIAQPLSMVESNAKTFWTDYLQSVQHPQLESDASSPARHIEVYDPRAMSDMPSFENKLRKQGLSLQSVFFAAYARAYSYNTDPTAEDVIIGIYLANRSHLEDLSSLAAPTLNLVPLRVRSPTRTSLAELAKQIRKDLQTISTPENSSAGLWEIEAWTGVTVDTFVNFVKVPDNDDDAAGKQAIVMDQEAEQHRTEKRSHVSDTAGDNFIVPQELQHGVLKKTYKVNCLIPRSLDMVTNFSQRSLDIEATVADGALGIGVFGWEDMMDVEQAEGLIEELKIEIEGVLES
jgi:aryl carrier-like protein